MSKESQLFTKEASFREEEQQNEKGLFDQADIGEKSLKGSSLEKNEFGGGNANSLYVPMSETEQEVLERLVTAGELEVRIPGWGTLKNPKVKFGDLRVAIYIRLNLAGLPSARSVSFLNLELWTHSGICLFTDRQPTLVEGKPLLVTPGMEFSFVWDIAIAHMDPALVKMLVPGATGLTSRRQDKDTGEMTVEGNMKLDSGKKKKLHKMEELSESFRR